MQKMTKCFLIIFFLSNISAIAHSKLFASFKVYSSAMKNREKEPFGVIWVINVFFIFEQKQVQSL